jgi:exonuclease VII small subunit
MSLENIIAALEDERHRLTQAIDALQAGRSAKGHRRKRGARLNTATRKRISEGMKRRWAQRKKKTQVT